MKKEVRESLRQENEELKRKLQQFERLSRNKDSIWEARLRYARRGLEVTNRELALTNSKLARAVGELESLRGGLERKVQERTKELRRERDRIQRIIAQLSDGLLLIDDADRISLINARAEYFLGISSVGVLHHKVKELFSHPEAGDFFQFVAKLSQRARGRFELTKPEQKVLEISKTHLRGGEKTAGTIVLLHDVTREAMVEGMKSEFVSLAAHQLRTPLSAIKWVFSLLLGGDAGKLTDDQKGLVEKGQLSNERMIRLVNDLLDVVRIEEGRFNYTFKLTSPVDVIQKAIQEWRLAAEQKGLLILFHQSKEEIPKIYLDEDKFRLALANIIDNAIHYTPPGGNIGVTVSSDKKTLHIVIRDTGIGISKTELSRLFTKFFRGARAQRLNTTGSGLGLFIVKNIIEKHQGQILIDSKEKEGTTVRLVFPLKFLYNRQQKRSPFWHRI